MFSHTKLAQKSKNRELLVSMEAMNDAFASNRGFEKENQPRKTASKLDGPKAERKTELTTKGQPY
jgi:hypothetical protein